MLHNQNLKPPGIVTMPADFDEVQLTDEEKELAIFDARCMKYYNQKAKKEFEAVQNEKKEATRPFTTSELIDHVLKRNPWFRVDDQAKPVFELLALYFSNNPEFENRGYSLKKGICIIGPVGVGKTELLNVFRHNKRQCFHMLTVFDIESQLQEKGIEAVNIFCGPVPGWGNNKRTFYQPEIGWAFDDVGRESVVFDFGNKTDAISKIIQTRYFKRMPPSSLHITTNKTPTELEKRYDEAVRSRLRETLNYIIYEGKDRRK